MSMAPRFSVQEQPPSYLKYNLAIHILNDISPRILSINNPLSTRVATAYTWFLFLRQNSPPICDKLCRDIDLDQKKWGEQELTRIAEALTEYASKLVNEALHIADKTRKRVKPPESPVT